jgi:SAM-dependent methyltransferase
MIPGNGDHTDKTGLITLQRFSKANRFNEWMFHTLSPYLKGDVLEIGSGIGNLSDFFLKHNIRLTASEINSYYCEILSKRFSGHPCLAEVRQLDIEWDNQSGKLNDLAGRFDTVVALNVIEHIRDHDLAIQNCRLLLKKGGTLVVLVPSYPILYNSLDKALAHYRRYTGKSLQAVLENNGLRVIKKMHFNLGGVFGWAVAGLMRKKILPEGQLRWYNRLVPLWKTMDNIFFHSIGLSVIQIACRRD